jgi:ABC-type sugar transport system substrate-binding protein
MKELITEARELIDDLHKGRNEGERIEDFTREILLKLCDALEKAEKELDIVYALADNMANGTHKAVQAYNDWLHAGETVYEEGE